jgi:hypothetical protein
VPFFPSDKRLFSDLLKIEWIIAIRLLKDTGTPVRLRAKA